MKNGATKPLDIRKRAFAYSLRAIKLYQFMQEKGDGAARIIGRQFLRSATSIGANLEEAQGGVSKADFIYKTGIAQKEARESLYWLELLCQGGLVPKKKISLLITETRELIAILSKIIIVAKKRKSGPAGNSDPGN